MKSWGLLAGALLLAGSLAHVGGQGQVQFDAATIKLDQLGPGACGLKGGPGTNDPGRVTWRKVWLRDLMAKAFDVDPRNISGPAWISRNGAQLYAFTATMPAETGKPDFELMLQRFLTEQFRIKLHHEPNCFRRTPGCSVGRGKAEGVSRSGYLRNRHSDVCVGCPLRC
jgi:hypothetical protein